MTQRQTALHIVGEDDRPVGPGLTEPWNATLATLEQTLGRSAVRRWLRPLRPTGISAGRLSLIGPPSVVKWTAMRYGELVLDELRQRIPELRSIELIPDQPGSSEPAVRLGVAERSTSYRGW